MTTDFDATIYEDQGLAPEKKKETSRKAMWTKKVRLSLLGIVGLPPIFLLSLTNLQQAIFVSKAAQLGGGLVLGLLLGLLAGFIWWSSKVLKGVFTWVSVLCYLPLGVAWVVTGRFPLEGFRHWGETDWAGFLPFFGLCLVVSWCAWVLLRDVAGPLLFASARESGRSRDAQSSSLPPIAATHQQTSLETVSVAEQERFPEQVREIMQEHFSATPAPTPAPRSGWAFGLGMTVAVLAVTAVLLHLSAPDREAGSVTTHTASTDTPPPRPSDTPAPRPSTLEQERVGTYRTLVTRLVVRLGRDLNQDERARLWEDCLQYVMTERQMEEYVETWMR